MSVSRLSAPYRYDEIARHIGRLILSGKYPPGSVIAGELVACKQFSASRTTYREAIRILSAKGLLDCRPRLGTRVTPAQQWHLLDPNVLEWIFAGRRATKLRDAYHEFCLILEPCIAECAAQRRGPTQLEQLEASICRLVASEISWSERANAAVAFYLAVGEATNNRFLSSLARSLSGVPLAQRLRIARGSKSRETELRQYMKLYRAIRDQDLVRARRAMKGVIEALVTATKPVRQRQRNRAAQDSSAAQDRRPEDSACLVAMPVDASATGNSVSSAVK